MHQRARTDLRGGRGVIPVPTATYHAVPTNYPALSAFRYHVARLWLRTLRRRSQKDRFSWKRMIKLATDLLPQPKILHPWPSVRFAVTTQSGSRMP
jgi:hypothetical protein